MSDELVQWWSGAIFVQSLCARQGDLVRLECVQLHVCVILGHWMGVHRGSVVQKCIRKACFGAKKWAKFPRAAQPWWAALGCAGARGTGERPEAEARGHPDWLGAELEILLMFSGLYT